MSPGADDMLPAPRGRSFRFPGVLRAVRAPASAVPSYSAQMSLPRRQHRGKTKPHAMSERVMHRFKQGVDRGAAACDRFPDARISHLRYEDLTRDPIEAIRQSFSEVDLEVSSKSLIIVEVLTSIGSLSRISLRV